ncbi:MAG: DUF853 family protein [Leptonema sp. (in: Bacteria)]|nr:DUF853 family protein [Leptonema sp. (in: bacteria)]
MSKTDTSDFSKRIQTAYTFKGDTVLVGLAMLDNSPVKDTLIHLPLKTLNRHGLIAGATGTGKTKSLQGLAGALSKAGVPSLLMDIKGDLSGLGAAGESSEVANKRANLMGYKFQGESYPIEFLTLSNEKGAKLRATVTEFGPILLGKILSLNEAQQSLLAVIMRFCDEQGLLLLDLKDLKKVLNFVANEGKAEFEAEYGKVSTASSGTILRKIVALEDQGADVFFGEPSFEVSDLVRLDENGHGILSVVRLTDMQNRPALFSTFMLQLLAEVFEVFPEIGDSDRPKLVLFIDEAHLIFNEASKVLVNQIETVIKLIRSRGVGVIFCTQSPDDIPSSILSQLGMKIQHSLRAFTAKDRKAVKTASENFPESKDYQVDRLITELGIGEAFVTCLDEKGRPTPLVHTLMAPPASRMDVLTDNEIDSIIKNSKIIKKYNTNVDRESAYEVLSKRIDQRSVEEEVQSATPTKITKKTVKPQPTMIEKAINSSFVRDIGRTLTREVTRSILGSLGIKKR